MKPTFVDVVLWPRPAGAVFSCWLLFSALWFRPVFLFFGGISNSVDGEKVGSRSQRFARCVRSFNMLTEIVPIGRCCYFKRNAQCTLCKQRGRVHMCYWTRPVTGRNKKPCMRPLGCNQGCNLAVTFPGNVQQTTFCLPVFVWLLFFFKEE